MPAPFTQRYAVSPALIPAPSLRRSGIPLVSPARFVVAHDTGNRGSTAAQNVAYYRRSRDELQASAHLFVDDKEILECVPALTGPPEKAWHVHRSVPDDNRLFGADANDAAIGIEYCWGGNIDPDQAYRKYVWVMAAVCHRFGLDPAKSIVGHFFLDPKRRTDPVTGLADSRRTYDGLLRDVAAEYAACTGAAPAAAGNTFVASPGKARATARLNVRKGRPDRLADVVQIVTPGTELAFDGHVTDGEAVNGNAIWYRDANGNFYWSGGVSVTA